MRPRVWLLMALLVLLGAAALRLAQPADLPPGLAQDEVLDADIAAFIRRGEHAFFFRHGYGHEPLYHYWAVPFQALFGDNVLSIRLPAVYLGLILIALTLRWARGSFSAAAALTAGAGLAVSWWPIIFSRIGIRPILEPVLLVLAVWVWPVQATEIGRRSLLRATLAGIVLGLSLYSYTAARVMLLLPPAMMAHAGLDWLLGRLRPGDAGKAAERAGVRRAWVGHAGIVLLASLATAIPLWLTLRANPELQQRLAQLEGPLVALQQGDWRPALQTTIATLGVFSFSGDPRWTYSLPGRPLFDPITSLLFYGGLLLAAWRWRQPAYFLLAAWLGLAMLPSALSPDAPSTVRLIGALPVVYLMPGLAVATVYCLFRVRRQAAAAGERARLGLLLAAALLLLGFNLLRTVRDGFIRWPSELETRLRYQSVLLDIARRYDAQTAPQGPPVVADAFFEPIDADSLRRDLGRDPQARWIQSGDSVAGAMVWPAGTSPETRSLVYVPEFAPLDADLVELAGVESEPEYRSSGAPSFAVYALPADPPALAAIVEALFRDPAGAEQDHGLRLLGFIPQTDAQPDDWLIDMPGALSLATLWEAIGPLPDDAALFVHLRDEDGRVAAQHDGLDVGPRTLRPGDRLLQRHILTLAEPLPVGEYLLVAGLYRRGEGRRYLTQSVDSVILARCNRSDLEERLHCHLPAS